MTNPALQVSHLTKTYPAFKLDDVSFEVEAGTCTALIGENGSGKSTILRCLLSEIVPESGEIRFYGHNPKEEISTHALIGSCKDHLLFPEFFTPAMVSQLFARLYPLWDARGFEDFLQKQKISMNQPLKKMSRGMKAKVSLATAMHHQAPLLLLDEATSGLDPVVREEMLDALQEYRCRNIWKMKTEAFSLLLIFLLIWNALPTTSFSYPAAESYCSSPRMNC